MEQQIGNSSANAFPFLLLAGSAESHLLTKGAFQELDAISFLTPHTKLAIRPRDVSAIPDAITNAYRAAWYGRPGPTFVDVPADIITGINEEADDESATTVRSIPSPPKPAGDPSTIEKIASLLRTAKAPLIIIGKGAAYARSESVIRNLVNTTQIPFLPTPMGKGVVPDSHPLNASSARSAALKHADVILLLGARLNWILHFGEAPKFRADVRIAQVDISAEEIGRNTGDAELGVVGDVGLVVGQLLERLSGWKYMPSSLTTSTTRETYPTLLSASAQKNERAADTKALAQTQPGKALSYQRIFHLIKEQIHTLSPSSTTSDTDTEPVYVSEGANTMDISRSIFPLENPRHRLDAGTHATMGVGLGYIIAAHAAYNLTPSDPSQPSTPTPKKEPKRIIAFEGDSALGFSGMEIETMARYRIPAIIFVLNNSGIYHGDVDDAESWTALQRQTLHPDSPAPPSTSTSTSTETEKKGLRSTSLLYETRYDALASMCGNDNLARGWFVRSEEELVNATREAWRESGKGVVCVVNVVVVSGKGGKVGFKWQESAGGKRKKKSEGKAKL